MVIGRLFIHNSSAQNILIVIYDRIEIDSYWSLDISNEANETIWISSSKIQCQHLNKKKKRAKPNTQNDDEQIKLNEYSKVCNKNIVQMCCLSYKWPWRWYRIYFPVFLLIVYQMLQFCRQFFFYISSFCVPFEENTAYLPVFFNNFSMNLSKSNIMCQELNVAVISNHINWNHHFNCKLCARYAI